jgi:hypothetical protein
LPFNKMQVAENSPSLSTVVYESMDPLPTKELKLEMGVIQDEKFFRTTARWYFRAPFAKTETERRRLVIDLRIAPSRDSGDPTAKLRVIKAFDDADGCACDLGLGLAPAAAWDSAYDMATPEQISSAVVSIAVKALERMAVFTAPGADEASFSWARVVLRDFRQMDEQMGDLIESGFKFIRRY